MIIIWVFCVVMEINCVSGLSNVGCRLVLGLFRIINGVGCGDNRVVVNRRYCKVLLESFVVWSGCNSLFCCIRILKYLLLMVILIEVLGKVLLIVLVRVEGLLILIIVCSVVGKLELFLDSIGVFVLIFGKCVGVF